MSDRAALVAFAKESIARGSKSFALASRLFDRKTRERAWLLYAWCRKCDDMADGQDHGGAMAAVADPIERLTVIRELTAKALSDEPTGEPAFDALGVVARECGLTQKMADDVIEGFALDAADWHPRRESDLYRYCYHVAGAVGVMMAVVMGVRPDDDATLDRACDLGLAFQLANIARDIEEDDAAGRCYLPDDWLAQLDIAPGEQMRPHNRPKLALMARWLTDEAGQYEASARVGAARLPFRARWAVLAAAGIYGDIARKVRRAGEQAWDRRIYTSRREKLRWVIKALGQSSMAPKYASRSGLWTRLETASKSPLDKIKSEIEDILVIYGIKPPIDYDKLIISELNLDDEDWAFDFIPELEKLFAIDLLPLVLSDETKKFGLWKKTEVPLARDVSIHDIAQFILDRQKD